MLEVNNIFFGYSNKQILNNISLELKQGDIISILGENGSGKSTLLKVIAGLKHPEAGEVKYNNQRVLGPFEKLIPGHNKVKMIFQDFNLSKFHTVEENVKNLLPPVTDEEKGKRTSKLLKLCRLTKLASSKVENLSGGEKQRLAIARALAEDPKVILMDEPFSNLDPLVKEEFKEILFKAIRHLNITTIFVTHEASDALKFSHKLFFLKGGKIVKQGDPDKIYLNPGSSYVARLTGPVNIFSAEKASLLGVITDSAYIFLRPEKIILTNPADSLITGVVSSSLFCGHYYEVEICVHSKVLIKAFSPNMYVEGDTVGVRINNN